MGSGKLRLQQLRLPTTTISVSHGLPRWYSLHANTFQCRTGSMLVEAWKPFPKSQFIGILDQIRNRLLDFLLELQQINRKCWSRRMQSVPFPAIRSRTSFKPSSTADRISLRRVRSSPKRPRRTWPPGTRSPLSITCAASASITTRSFELETAIEQDGDRQQKQLGKNVKSWIGKMIVKAMDGTWKVALATAPDLLKAALSRFYGGD